MEKIKGLIDAPFTPMQANGDINTAVIPAYAQMLVKNGLKGVFINGSSGEGYMLTPEERMELAEAWIKAVPEGFKVIVHVGSCCLRESERLAAHAAAIGAWGIGAMAPPFPKIGRIEELVKYCETIAAAAPSLPFYYYHIPAFNGAFLPMLDLLKAADGRIPNSPASNTLLKVCMSIISADCIKTANMICFTDKTKPYCQVSLRVELKAVSAVQPITMVVNSSESFRRGKMVTWKLPVRNRISLRMSLMSYADTEEILSAERE